jgi:hypothetical protein
LSQFEGQTIVCETQCPPEGNCDRVPTKDVDHNAPVLRIYLRGEDLDATSPNTGATLVALNKELAQVYPIVFLTRESVSDDTGIILKDGGSIVSFQPKPHSCDKLCNRHWISVTFILNQLMI